MQGALSAVKMADWKNYAMIILSVSLLASLGLNVMPEPTHYCDVREVTAHCFSLSESGKTCYTLPEKIGGKRCLEAPYWQEIPTPEQSTQLVVTQLVVIAYTDQGKYFCDGVGIEAICVRDDELLMPFE